MSIDPSSYRVESHTPPIWDSSPTFQEMMADQLRHAPWLLLSVLIHGVVIFVLLLIPAAPPSTTDESVKMEQPKPPEEIPEEEEPEPEPEPETPDEPVLQDQEIVTEEVTDQTFDDLDSTVESAFDNDQWNTALGLGGGGGGKFGRRGTGRARLGAKGRDTAKAIVAGLEWLKNHQDEDGRWDADDFAKHDHEGEPCDGAGNPVHDVGVTGLALLAFLGDGSTLRSGPYKDQVKLAVRWLRSQQEPANGLFGSDTSSHFIYDHAIATLAIIEAYGLSESQLLRKYAQKGLNYLEAHRNPYAVWRYQPRSGANDTSVTGWAVMAYKSAQDFDLTVNTQALKLCEAWFDQVTDPATGQCGYEKRGEPSSRHDTEHATRFPAAKGEALTAVGLMSRFFLGQDPEEYPVMERAADTILAKPPVWDPDTGEIDHYYWYYATYALYQMGRQHWKKWSEFLTAAVIKPQRQDGNYEGSWDPIGAWGSDGGRVYSTAVLVLTLEAYYRYSRVFVR